MNSNTNSDILSNFSSKFPHFKIIAYSTAGDSKTHLSSYSTLHVAGIYMLLHSYLLRALSINMTPISLLIKEFLGTSFSSGIGIPVASINLISAEKLFFTFTLSKILYLILKLAAST